MDGMHGSIDSGCRETIRAGARTSRNRPWQASALRPARPWDCPPFCSVKSQGTTPPNTPRGGAPGFGVRFGFAAQRGMKAMDAVHGDGDGDGDGGQSLWQWTPPHLLALLLVMLLAGWLVAG